LSGGPPRKRQDASAAPDWLRWRKTRRGVEHLLALLGGLTTLAVLVKDPLLQEGAAVLLPMWCAGLGLVGYLYFEERRRRPRPPASAAPPPPRASLHSPPRGGEKG
jgi:hypothetical protein